MGVYVLVSRCIDKMFEGSVFNWVISVFVRGGEKMEFSDYVMWVGFCVFLYFM